MASRGQMKKSDGTTEKLIRWRSERRSRMMLENRRKRDNPMPFALRGVGISVIGETEVPRDGWTDSTGWTDGQGGGSRTIDQRPQLDKV